MKTITEPAREIPIADDVDVVVAGGGPAGIIAAVAAARNGAKTLLVESHAFLGGVAALGIPIQGFHDDQDRQIVGGIGWELMERLFEAGASPGPWFFHEVPRAGGAMIIYDNSKLKTIAADMVREAGVRLLLHTSAVDPIREGNRLGGIVIQSKSGRQAVTAKVVIDASGDGDIAAGAGAEFQKGNSQGFLQPVTVLFRISNIDMKEFLGDVDQRPAEYGLDMPKPHYWADYQKGIRFGLGGLKDLCLQARARGEYDMPTPLLAIACLPREGDGLVNMALVKGVDATDNRDLTTAEITGGECVWKTMEFLRKYVKGFKNAFVSEIAPFVGIRETRRIVGDFILDVDDMKACTRFEDRIAMGGRGVDIHDPTPDGSQSCGSMYTRFPDAYYFPYGCLLPKNLENILLAGRCISVGYVAFGSTRVMAQGMAAGQAAGTAAALSASRGVSPREVDIAELQSLLKQQGAVID